MFFSSSWALLFALHSFTNAAAGKRLKYTNRATLAWHTIRQLSQPAAHAANWALLSLVGAGLAVRHGREFMPRPARHADAHVPPTCSAAHRPLCCVHAYAAIIAISAPLETRGSSDKTRQAVARRMRVCSVRACEGGAPAGRSARAACRSGRAGSRLASAAVSWTKQTLPTEHLTLAWCRSDMR